MAREQHVTGIDVGSSQVRVAVAQLGGALAGQSPTILGISAEPMDGMQKGVITDVEAAVASISKALDVAERVAGVPIEHAYVSINGSHIMSQNSRGVIAVSRADGEITADDVARVINAAQAISLPSNREILHVLPQNFVVDGQEHIHDPVGMTGVRLEVETHIIEGSAPFIKNITKAVNQAGVHVEDFVFSPLAAAQILLDKRQKELGVVLVDLGAGTTSLVVYEENALLHTAVLPLGSSHITNDIAIGLRTSIDVAEVVKVEHGTALADEIKTNEAILIEGDENNEQESVSRKEVATIIRARLEEIFSFVDRELKGVNRSGLLPAGIVFTGGGAQLPGVVEIAKKRLRLPARVGRVQEMSGLSEKAASPGYAVVLGLLLWAFDQEGKGRQRTLINLHDWGNTAHRIRGWLKTFMP
ncbi:MAG: cell division protein FtsA [Candidatus Andersenbacteria bacterium]|nr:cell division protein FtsA [bacterium]MDZ4225386.1 cell division protein FtsA [Candidatus Andersenbacteria bacterium]